MYCILWVWLFYFLKMSDFPVRLFLERVREKWRFLPVFLLTAIVLTACGAGGENPSPEPEENVLIYAALNPVAGEISQNIKRFNLVHEDVQIEIRDYSDENGIQRLLTELALGQVPDIMEMHRLGTGKARDESGADAPYLDRPAGEYWMPYRQMAQRGYLEDLWPYIEKDPELGREGVLEAPLKAAEVNGGLYMFFSEVSITTMIGPERVVGDRSGWTFDEMLETFSTMPEDSTILRFHINRRKVFDLLCMPLLDQYVNWETGENTFDSQGFRDMMQFLEAFPEEFETFLSQEGVNAELVERIVTGHQMLDVILIAALWYMPALETYFGEPAVCIGYPTADGSLGSYYNLHGNKLAMSTTCRNKEAAWDFIRTVLAKKHAQAVLEQKHTHSKEIKIPVLRTDYDLAKWLDRRDKSREGFPEGPLGMDYVTFPCRLCTDDDVERFETLVQNTTQIYWPNNDLSDIVWETIQPYYVGDRTLDDTLRLLDNRVTVYVNENR